jgi:asparagine synthase (glutamine-hydrolysing)
VHPEVSSRLLSSAVRDQLADYDPISVIESHYNNCTAKNPLNRELYTDIKTYLVDDILTKVDRASMAVALEVRVPLLDHRLVEFMARVPTNWKLRGGAGKVLLKNAFRGTLGTEIVDRPKQGFSVPLGGWLKGPLREMVEETVFARDAHVANWLDMQAVRSMWAAHLRGTGRMESMIWGVLMLEHWARNFLPAGSSPQPQNRPAQPVMLQP